jgi:hypothetical protein
MSTQEATVAKTTKRTSKLGIASLLVAVAAIAAVVFGVATIGFVLAVAALVLGVGAAAMHRPGMGTGTWIAGIIVALAVGLRLLLLL